MKVKRSFASTMGVVVATLILAGGSAPAQAESDVATVQDGGSSVAAESPTISPGPARPPRYTSSSTEYDCPREFACFAVYDPMHRAYKVFDLWACGTYALSNWLRFGSLRNSQILNAHVVLLDANRRPIGQPYPPDGLAKVVNWDPVYWIRPC